MHVFKLLPSSLGGPPFELRRRECELDELGDVIAISYAWGSLPHVEAYQFSSDLAIKLGKEWDHAAFLDELAALSHGAWLWLDQLSLRQNNATTKELNISIPTVFKKARVLVLLPGRECAERHAVIENALVNGWEDGRGLQASSLVIERLVHHARACEEACVGGVDVWLRRVWPWQEFAYASRIQVRFSAGMPRSSRYRDVGNNASGVTNDVMTLLRQQVLDKNVRLQVLDEHEHTQRFIRLLRGNEVDFGDVSEPTGQAMLNYMSNYVEQNRVCTKDTDLVSAVAPAICGTADAKVSLAEGVTNLIQHIEKETRTIFVGPLPCGVMDPSNGTARAHARTFEGLDDFSNVGKISFLHGTHFANDDLLANVDDSITVESFLTDAARYNGYEVRHFLGAMSLSQRRMLARWLSSWEPQTAVRGEPGIFDEALKFLGAFFARSNATIEKSGSAALYSKVAIRSPKQLLKFCLILLRVVDHEGSDLGDTIVSRCELVKITNPSKHLTAVGYQRRGSVSRLVAVGECLLLIDSTDNKSVVGRVPYADRDALDFLSCSTIRIGDRAIDQTASCSLAHDQPHRLSKVVRDTIASIRENTIEFVDLSGGHVDASAAVALCDELESNTSVKALLLHNNRIDSRGMIAIDRMLQCNRTLQAVHLPFVDPSELSPTLDARPRVVEWTHTGQSNWHRVFHSQETSSTWVDSTNIPMGTEALLALAEVIKYRTISSLHLANTTIDEDAMRALASGLGRNTTVYMVELKNNSIAEKAISALAQAIQVNKTIEVLYIQGNQIRGNGAYDLGAALKVNTTITQLSLVENEIDDYSAEAIVNGLRRARQLSDLNLRGNDIGDRGALAIAAALMDKLEVTALSLRENRVGNAGAKAFADALSRNGACSVINLSHNQIGDDGAKALAHSLATNDTLKTLDLSHNQIGDAGAKAIAEGLAKNTSLLDVVLSHNQIRDDGARAFLGSLRATATLERLHLNGNPGIGEVLRDELSEIVYESESLKEVSVDSDGDNFPYKLWKPTASTRH